MGGHVNGRLLQVGAVSTSHFSSQIGVWWACVFLTAPGPAGGLHLRLLLAPDAWVFPGSTPCHEWREPFLLPGTDSRLLSLFLPV